MIIEIVDIDGVVVFEAEDNAPIGAHRHGPETGETSLESMQSESGEVHVIGACTGVKPGQHVAHRLAMLREQVPRSLNRLSVRLLRPSIVLCVLRSCSCDSRSR